MGYTMSVPIPLYHGTDKMILDCSEKERIEIQEMCVSISDYSYHLLSEDGLSISTLSKYKAKRLSQIGDFWGEIIDAFQKYDSRKKGSNLYQYGSLYLTGDRNKAEGYAKDACILGEQGKVTYWLYKAATRIWNIKDFCPDAVVPFIRFGELIKKPRIPIILTFKSVLKDDLLRENGEQIDWDTLGEEVLIGLSYRLKLGSSTTISDGMIEYL